MEASDRTERTAPRLCCWCDEPATERLGDIRDPACAEHAAMWAPTYHRTEGPQLVRVRCAT